MEKEMKKKRKEILDRDFVKIFEDDVVLRNNIEAKRLVVEHCGGVNIIAVNDEKKLLLVRQYRYPIGRFTYETPAD